jgi:hypothetical protein
MQAGQAPGLHGRRTSNKPGLRIFTPCAQPGERPLHKLTRLVDAVHLRWEGKMSCPAPPPPSLGRKGLLRLSLKVDSLTNAGAAPVRYETLCGLGSEIRAQSGARGRGQRCVPHGLRISSHKPFRVGTVGPPLSRKGSSSGRICFCHCHQIGVTFLPAVTSEPVSQPLLQALTYPCCCHCLLPTHSVSVAGSILVESLLRSLDNWEEGSRRCVLLIFERSIQAGTVAQGQSTCLVCAQGKPWSIS